MPSGCKVLCSKDSLYGTHQRSPFTGKITENFFFEIRFKQVAATDSDTQRDNTIKCTAGCVLENGVAAVQSTSLQEHPAQ